MSQVKELVERYQGLRQAGKELFELGNYLDAPDLPAEIVMNRLAALAGRCLFRDHDNLDLTAIIALAESHERLLETSQAIRDSFVKVSGAFNMVMPKEAVAFCEAIEQAEKL